MASPMITGTVANILMVQPTLSFDGVIEALLNNSVNVSSGKCEEYECKAPIYSCGAKQYGDPIKGWGTLFVHNVHCRIYG